MPLLALDGDDARLELGWQLIGEPHRPPRPVAESLKSVLFVPTEDLVSGFAGNAEVPAHLGHRFAVQETGDKSQAFVHDRTLFPRHPHSPQKSGKCNPCVRYGMSPMSRVAHKGLADTARLLRWPFFAGPRSNPLRKTTSSGRLPSRSH